MLKCMLFLQDELVNTTQHGLLLQTRQKYHLLTDGIRDAILAGAGNAFANESRTVMISVE